MSISILNNISALAAENQLSSTQSALQKTLAQLSSGQRINTGADDAAGLAIADGLKGNISALTQSVQNATTGTGLLQVADGALSQVTSLLNRAVTLATEAANGTIGPGQVGAMNSEFAKIVNEIDSIGTNTYYNGMQVFSGSPLTIFMGDGSHTMSVSSTVSSLSSSGIGFGASASNTRNAIGNVADGDTVTVGSTVYRFKTTMAQANDIQIGGNAAATLVSLAKAINGTGTAGVDFFAGTGKSTEVSAVATGNTLTVTALTAGTGGNSLAATKSAANLGWTNTGGVLTGGAAGADLSNQTNAAAALTAVNSAIQTVAQRRGDIGAAINALQASTNVAKTQIQNLASSQDGIMAADIPSAVADMTKFNILQQTGMAALSQSNQMQQAVLKLLQ